MENQSKVMVISHSADADGWLSGHIAVRELTSMDIGQITHVPYNYGDPCPDLTGFERVYILDASVPEILGNKEVLEKVKVTWIDHHASAIAKYWPLIQNTSVRAYCIDGVAACRLTWAYFKWIKSDWQTTTLPVLSDFLNRIVSEPLIVRMVGERDVWDRRDPDAEPLNTALIGMTAEERRVVFSLLLHEQGDGNLAANGFMLRDLIMTGRAIGKWQAIMNESICKHSCHTITFGDLKFRVLNTARGNSNSFVEVVDPSIQALMLWRYNGTKCLVSLYHADKYNPENTKLDLSQLAVRMGGGGHKGACGFSVSLVEMAEILEGRHAFTSSPDPKYVV